jgi:hypothetical protein
LALGVVALTAPHPAEAAAPAKPVIGQQERWPEGLWSAVPQAGPDGKVKQCTLVSMRERAGPNGAIDTRFALVIGRGAGFVITLGDAQLPREDVLDDRAEIIIDGRPFPAVGFPVQTSFAFHPGDAAAALKALRSAKQVALRSTGAGIDSGAITIALPGEPLAWLQRCGETFKIATDRPTDPDAPALPVPRPPSPEFAAARPTAAGPAGIEDKQKISGWDASELRNPDGRVFLCMIRRHYVTGSEADSRKLGVFMMASRPRGLSLMLKDSQLSAKGGESMAATLTSGGAPVPAFVATVQGPDEIGLFPKHGGEFAAAINHAERLAFKSEPIQLEFPVAGALPWLRACAKRHGIALEAPAEK